ncbi:exonuclease [Leptolyngbya sp. 'hensonii']|uniref:PD-(D/E)XK nuclease family protein n=1 Tax=Leptolyngbya sp. 'hensonii' TaxID=1922337 RepID=UPI00094FD1ED|nr:PD-(D/E)XK nuclease family protein [Leptolyngbya sp. 'hensonii']OLP16062.1 exonuclease [Leptolyngbya sp. 'hensonii']
MSPTNHFLPRLSLKSVWQNRKQYYLDQQGLALPSISTILNATKPAEDWERLMNWKQRVGAVEASRIAATASRRGTGTHRQIERYLAGEAIDCPDGVKPYWESIQPVLQEIDAVRLLESPVLHYDVGYAGQVDCVASYQGTPCICEWKTADRPKESWEGLYDYPLQVVAYCGAVNHSYQNYGLQVNHGLLVIALPDQAAEIFWFEPDTIRKYWQQWHQRVLTYQRRQARSPKSYL